MSATPPTGPRSGYHRRRIVIPAAVLAAAVALVAVYGMAGFARNPAAAACADARPAAQRIAPLARGEVAALTVPSEPRLLPPLAFNDGDGKRRTLADWQGRTVLLNLWATWCLPCRQEMPALDDLQAKLGSEKFEVVAVNIDTRDVERPRTWLKEAKVSRLAYYADPQAKIFQDLKAAGKAFGMPTTLLIDPKGCELGSLAGAAHWSSEDALRLIRAALGT